MIDWAAKWFEIRAEMGQSDMATLMYQDKSGPWVQCHFRHRESDGFGRIQTLLQDQGLIVKAPIRPLKKPSPWKQPFLLIKGILSHPKLSTNPWKDFDSSLPSAGLEEVSSWFLTEEENLKLQKLAKLHQLNTGFFILSEMDRRLRSLLFKDPSHNGTWLCPVDVRGAHPEAQLNRNWVSFIVSEFQGPSNSQSIQEAFQRYKTSLKSGQYWAFWELYQIGKYVGLAGMKKIAARAHNKSFWMGSFSDLGVWNQEALRNSPAKDRHWVIGPPGSTSYPIGVTTIEWCGKRSITLKIHPGICNRRNVEVASQILNEFKKTVLAEPAFISRSNENPMRPEYR